MIVEPLGAQHDRRSFSCGEPALDRYLAERASQDIKRRVAQVFIAVGDAPDKIAGYYTLNAASFRREALSPEFAEKLPHYPVPAALIGRLAVDRAYQGRRLGEYLLMDAARRVVHASREVGIHAIVVDAKGDAARRFYERFGFISFPDTPLRLFLPVETFVKAGL